VLLFDNDGLTLLDSISFGPQQGDVATARLLDGRDPWVTVPLPTPYGKNAPLIGGIRHYSALQPLAHRMVLGLNGEPKLGTTPGLTFAGGPPNNWFFALLSLRGTNLAVAGDVALLAEVPPLMLFAVPSDPSGLGSLPLSIPSDPLLVGAALYGQALAFEGPAFVIQASNGMELVLVQ
jgi:hypothetical protein